MLNGDLLTGADGAARYLGIKTTAIYHMVKCGQLPVIRKGRRLYFRKSDLDRAFTSDAASAA